MGNCIKEKHTGNRDKFGKSTELTSMMARSAIGKVLFHSDQLDETSERKEPLTLPMSSPSLPEKNELCGGRGWKHKALEVSGWVQTEL